MRSVAALLLTLPVFLSACRTGSLLAVVEPRPPLTDPAHPKGRWIAFKGKDGLRVLELPSRASRLLEPDGGRCAWSPDGTMLAYSYSILQSPGLYVAEAETGRILRLTSVSGWDGDPAWSPDGTKIAFVHRTGGDDEWVCMADLAKGTWETLFSNDGMVGDLSWSRDSRTLCFHAQDARTRHREFRWS